MTEPEAPFLPFAKASIGEDEIRAVVDALKSGWITMGPKTAEFERAFGESIGVPYARAVSSCTAAMHLALVAHGIGEGAEVVVPSLTFAATGNVVEHVGARPVFAEIDESTWNVTRAAIEAKLTDRTRAVMAVHYAGLPCDIDGIRALCKERSLVLIEDAAHAVGSRYRDKPVGAHGNTTCFSFYATKNLTTGEGGMVVTDSPEIAHRIEVLRLHGMSRDAWRRYSAAGNWRYDILEAGFKYNMTDLNAALGIVQLARQAALYERRVAIAARYRKLLGGLPGLRFQGEGGPGDRHGWHLFAVRLVRAEGAPSRDAVLEKLAARRIGFSVHFIPLHTMSHYRERGCRVGDLPVTERVAEELLSLPFYPDLADADVERVAAGVRESFAK